ncbi:MAG: hypothetical protein DHS80DRAFT_30630 [Piptocephalis tieghemiana]|nr:MAG: hypothetical protein DHS80DRAFT_30630 [Piptocephalis tieghemiana]
MSTTTPSRPLNEDPPPPYSLVPPPNHTTSQVAASQEGGSTSAATSANHSTQPDVIITPSSSSFSAGEAENQVSSMPEESYIAAAQPVHLTRPRPQSLHTGGNEGTGGGGGGGRVGPNFNPRISSSHSPTRPPLGNGYGGGLGRPSSSCSSSSGRRPTWSGCGGGMAGARPGGRPFSIAPSTLGSATGEFSGSPFPGPGSPSRYANVGRRPGTISGGTSQRLHSPALGSLAQPQEILRVCQDYPCWKCSDTGIKPSGRACRRCNMGQAVRRIMLLGRGRNVVIQQLCWRCRGTGRSVHSPLSFRFAGIQFGTDPPPPPPTCDRCRGTGTI